MSTRSPPTTLLTWLGAADLPELDSRRVKVAAEVCRTGPSPETIPIPKDRTVAQAGHDRLGEGELLPDEYDLLSTDIEKVQVRRTVSFR